jgi:predicted ArsR family transcriptional regulator
VVPPEDLDARIAAIAALDQPIRRDLYRWLSRADDWMTRDAAAEALAVPRAVAAFHLDKLVEAGVLDVRFERTTGKSGPGAGRPSKLYRPSPDEVGASVPDRHYDLAGSLLATAVAESAHSGVPVVECLSAAARAAGRELGAAARECSVHEALSRFGYEPDVDATGDIVLHNCPFHLLAEQQRDLVCGMNLDFVEGLIDGVAPAEPLTPRLDPATGYCCVRLRAAEPTVTR